MNNGKLPCVHFMAFHQWIVDGNVEAVQDVLSRVTSEVQQKHILNSEISYTEQLAGRDEDLQFKLPLALAAASGNTHMLQLLLR